MLPMLLHSASESLQKENFQPRLSYPEDKPSAYHKQNPTLPVSRHCCSIPFGSRETPGYCCLPITNPYVRKRPGSG